MSTVLLLFHKRSKAFLNLLQAIEKGIITIRFKISTFLSGPRKGEIHNHGIDFAILENYLKEIYEPVFKK